VYINEAMMSVSRNASQRQLRSSGGTNYIVTRTMMQFSKRVFSVSGPSIWNSLVEYIRSATNIPCFKRHLKTCYFNIHCNTPLVSSVLFHFYYWLCSAWPFWLL